MADEAQEAYCVKCKAKRPINNPQTVPPITQNYDSAPCRKIGKSSYLVEDQSTQHFA